MARSPKAVRLSADVAPRSYEIHLRPDLGKFTFRGEETIRLELRKPTATITLHAAELAIQSAEIADRKEPVIASRIEYDTEAETVSIHFSERLPPGEAALRLAFSGVLNDRMRGFYRSSYTDRGKHRYLATTQFESTDARRAFPCFDEPAMKAIFNVSLTVPQEMTALSNTLPLRTRRSAKAKTKTVIFQPTPLMSTYLLAFIVGDLEHLQKKSKGGVLVRVFTTPGKREQGRFALDVAAQIVDFFNQYFDIAYPLPKIDLIAIPDFAAGAMENWGAITYRENALLVDPHVSSTRTKQWVGLVIAHELAHQWFGNLVTMEWWTHLWLNEGFASYIEYLAVDHIFPEWDIWTQFLVSDHGHALHYDALLHTHPIEVAVRHPAEIASVFDAVSYSKGAALLRMIAEYLGPASFRDGLRSYLKKHRYGNAVTEDLWDALSRASGKPIGTIIADWTRKPGYPLISVRETADALELRQARFFASPQSRKESRDRATWHVPVSYMTSEMESGIMLHTKMASIRRPRGAWIKLNRDESGFYRTLYPEAMRRALAEPVAAKRLTTRDRLGLIRDLFAIAETGELSSVDALAFARHYAGESEYVVWAILAGGLAKIRSLIAREPFPPRFDSFALSLFQEIRKTMDWAAVPKRHADALLKVLVLENLGKYGDRATIEAARSLFAKAGPKRNRIPADLRSVVYTVVATHGGRRDYAKLISMYKAESLHEEKNRIGVALGAFKEAALLRRTLEFSLSKHVRPQDSVRMIAAVAANPSGADEAWSFIQRHWKEFERRYRGTRELSYLLEPLGLSASERKAREIEKFIEKHPAPGTERTAAQVLERIRSNAAWLSRDKTALEAFLSE